MPTHHQPKFSIRALQLGLLFATTVGLAAGISQVATATGCNTCQPAPTASMSNISASITKTGGADQIEAGKTYTYTLTPTITAAGCKTARNLTITETLPAFLTYQPSSGKTPTQVFKNSDGTTTLIWNLGNLSVHIAIPPITYVAVFNGCTKTAVQGTDQVVISLIDDKHLLVTATQQNLISYYPPVVNRPKVLLVKRIAAINTTRFTTVFDPKIAIASDPNHSHANPYWPTNYLQGAGVPEDPESVRVSKVKPGDQLEYTIYFLNAGTGGAKRVRICDVLTPNQTYIPGVTLTIGAGATKITGAESQVQYIPAGGSIPANCGIQGGSNINGVVVIDVTSDRLPVLPGATVQADKSYGFVSFRTKVN